MPKTQKKCVRCPYRNKNIWIELEIEKDASGEELLVGMVCKERDLLEKEGVSCNTECKNYFFSDE